MDHAQPETVAYVAWLNRQERYEESLAVASAVLRQGPEDISVQHLVIAAQVARGEGELVLSRSRAWLAEAPDQVLRRLVLADALLTVGQSKQRGDQSYCREADRLLTPLSPDPELRYWGARLQLQAVVDSGCPGNKAEKAQQVLTEGRDWPLSQGYRVALQIHLPIDAERAALLNDTWNRYPWWLSEAIALWSPDATGVALKQAQAEALAAAELGRQSRQPAVVWGAWRVAGVAGAAPLKQALARHLQRLDPEWAPPVSGLQPGRGLRPGRPGGEEWEEWRQIQAAYRADPQEYERDWVEAAAYFHQHQRAALRTVQRMLTAEPAGTSVLGGWAEWRDMQLKERAKLYQIAGNLQEDLHQPEAAAASYRSALLLSPSWQLHLALGSVLSEDHPVEALSELLTGLSQAPASASLDAPRRLAESLWGRGLWWDPAGVGGLVDSLRTAPAVAAPVDPWIGRDFPNFEMKISGKLCALSDFPGVVLVDMWATWCAPCIASLPHLEKLALNHPDVTVLAISVDESEEEMQEYLADIHPAFKVVWAGPDAMMKLGIQGIPHSFVLDAEHKVRAQWQGFDPDDRRLERLLDP